jgi:GT2 family glycosyltransferase
LIVVRLHKNTGMTGYNVGLATARGKYVIMLDDDSHLAPDAVSNMVKLWETEENRDVGAMAFRVVNPINGSLVTHLWEERLNVAEPGREREITSFAACGAAVRRDVLDEVGYFDDDFFLYATEDDLSIRIWNAGYKIVYEPRCGSFHRESALMRNWKRYGFGFRNATWFNIKHVPLHLLPLMFVRNLFWLVTRSFRFKSFQYFFYGFVGLFKGYLQFSIPLSKRKPVKTSVAKFCLNDNWITRPIFSTSWTIYRNKRYILDKRGVSPSPSGVDRRS